jgi:hypothetical protein
MDAWTDVHRCAISANVPTESSAVVDHLFPVTVHRSPLSANVPTVTALSVHSQLYETEVHLRAINKRRSTPADQSFGIFVRIRD